MSVPVLKDLVRRPCLLAITLGRGMSVLEAPFVETPNNFVMPPLRASYHGGCPLLLEHKLGYV